MQTNTHIARPRRRRHLRRAGWIALAVCGSVLVLALLPPVQAAMLRHLLGSSDAAQIEFAGFGVGPWGLHLVQLRIETPQTTISVAEARLDFAFWASLSRMRLDVEQATVTDLRIAIAASDSESAAGGAPRTPPGRIEDRAVWPDWLALRQAAASGSVSLRDAADIEYGASFELIATDWRPDAGASAQLTGMATARRQTVPVAGLDYAIEIAATIAADAGIDEILSAIALSGTEGKGALAATGSAVFAGPGERYALTLDTGIGQRLAELSAEVDDNGLVLADWQIDLPSGVIAAFARGNSRADLTAASRGRLAVDPAQSSVQIMGSAEIVGSGWEAWDPRLEALGTLSLAGSADGSLTPDTITADAGQLSLSSQNLGDLLVIEVLQPLRFETGSWLIDPETWGEPALSVRLEQMPMRWLGQFDPSARVRDGTLDFAFTLIRDDQRITRVLADKPLIASGITLKPLRGVQVPGFDLTVQPQTTLVDGTLETNIEQMTIASDSGLIVSFQGSGSTSRANWPLADFDGELSARVPALTRIMPALDAVHATASLRFDFNTLVLSVTGASAGADTADGRRIFAADLSSQAPLSIPLPQFLPDWDAFEPQTVTVRLDRMPVDWLSPYLPELALISGEVSGGLAATTDGARGLRLTAEAPMTIDGLLPVYRGRAAAQAMTATVRPSLELTSSASRLDLQDFELRTRGGDTLSGAMSVAAVAGADMIEFELALDGRFPTLAERTGAGLGALRLRQHANIDRASRRIDVETLEFELSDNADNAFLTFENLQPFFVNAEPLFISSAGSSPDILRVSVAPLRLEQLLPQVLGLDLAGVLPEGEFFVRTEGNGGLLISADEPLRFRDVTVRWDDTVLLDRVTMNMNYEIAYSADGFEARSVDLEALAPDGDVMLRSTNRIVAPLNAVFTWSEVESSLMANLPALRAQPVLAGLPAFTSGQAQASFGAVNGDTTTVALHAALSAAATADLGALPDVELDVDASGVSGENLRLTIPLSLSSAQYGASDLRFEGSLERAAEGPDRFTATLTGTRLAYADVSLLTELITPPRADAGNVTAGIAAIPDRTALAKLRADRHTDPIWTTGLEGSAALTIDELVLPSFAVENLGGRLELAPQFARLSDLHASLLGAGLSAEVSAGFDAAHAAPYSLEFSTAVDQFELGELFRLAAPGRLPTAEGRFDFTASLVSQGLNPVDLGMSALGEIRLTGQDGVFRGLADIAGTGSTASRVIGLLTFSRELRAVARLLEGLGEIHFDSAEFVLARQSRTRLDLPHLSLRSPQVALDASGSLTLAPRRPLLLSPLVLDTSFAARGDVAILFDGMKLLVEEGDDASEQDYRAFVRPIRITGTPAEPDASAFWALLDEGAENARGSFGVGLRTLNRKLENQYNQED